MLQLKNSTPFKAALLPLPDPDGVDAVFAIVKATFNLGERMALADAQLPVAMTDVHYGDPAKTSLRVPSDVSMGKPGTDVLLVGNAWAPGGRPTWQAEVSLAATGASKTVRVFGDRVWDAGPAGAAARWVAPFVRMPLVWERAFGGVDDTDAGPIADVRNPVGVGFRTSKSLRPVHEARLPNLEDPASPISSPRDAPAPACLAPVAPGWEPRRSYAGTYDERWQATRAPYLPRDFDPRFFQLAPAGLATPAPLRGGEPIEVRGATPSGLLRFELPAISVDVTYRVDSAAESRVATLGTVIVEPDASRLVMVWHSAFSCDKRTLRVREIEPTVRRAA